MFFNVFSRGCSVIILECFVEITVVAVTQKTRDFLKWEGCVLH